MDARVKPAHDAEYDARVFISPIRSSNWPRLRSSSLSLMVRSEAAAYASPPAPVPAKAGTEKSWNFVGAQSAACAPAGPF